MMLVEMIRRMASFLFRFGIPTLGGWC
jgi:hypothetical protein